MGELECRSLGLIKSKSQVDLMLNEVSVEQAGSTSGRLLKSVANEDWDSIFVHETIARPAFEPWP